MDDMLACHFFRSEGQTIPSVTNLMIMMNLHFAMIKIIKHSYVQFFSILVVELRNQISDFIHVQIKSFHLLLTFLTFYNSSINTLNFIIICCMELKNFDCDIFSSR